jgi:hypothetical protein
MTAASPPGPQGVAARVSVCGAPGCHQPIEPGMLITKPPGRAWRHASCADPWAGRRRRPRPEPGGNGELGRLMRARSFTRPLPAPAPLHVMGRRRLCELGEELGFVTGRDGSGGPADGQA